VPCKHAYLSIIAFTSEDYEDVTRSILSATAWPALSLYRGLCANYRTMYGCLFALPRDLPCL
jgi:hypothetical protein